MSIKNLTNQVIALAGVYQACHQVKSVAWKGQCETEILDTAIDSLFRIDAANLDDIYGGHTNLEQGLQILANELNPKTAKVDHELTRYVLSLVSIEKKLSKRPDISELIQSAIMKATMQLEHFGAQHPNTWAALADIYQRTISHFSPRIIVGGERLHLANETNATKIRTLLLAGLRSMVLWRQCGGSRIRLLFSRRNYFHEANSLLAT